MSSWAIEPVCRAGQVDGRKVKVYEVRFRRSKSSLSLREVVCVAELLRDPWLLEDP